jgi:hypothetical protein
MKLTCRPLIRDANTYDGRDLPRCARIRQPPQPCFSLTAPSLLQRSESKLTGSVKMTEQGPDLKRMHRRGVTPCLTVTGTQSGRHYPASVGSVDPPDFRGARPSRVIYVVVRAGRCRDVRTVC